MSTLRNVQFRFQFSDWTLFSIQRPLLARAYSLDEAAAVAASAAGLHTLPTLPPGCMGLMLRSVPVADARVHIGMDASVKPPLLRYVMQCFPRYYIDMAQGFDEYRKKFSSKTRATLTRKTKKFADLGDGPIRWERITRAEELDRFWTLARQVSVKTYQERLLDAGLPVDPGFIAEAKRQADADCLRAFLLFDGDRPVSYLYCPVQDGIVIYAYLGYDPDYLRLSVGTVLQWLAVESLFAEQRFRYFDFTEGESEHKRLFSTGHLDCANVALLRPTLANRLLVHSHMRFGRAVEALGNWLEAHDLKKRIRSWLRFGRGASA